MNIEHYDGTTPIDPNEAEGLIPSLTTQAELNEFEALNIVDGRKWARESRKVKISLLSQTTLKLIHKKMFGMTWTWAGNYRRTQKSIGCEAWNISSQMETLLGDLDFWVNHGTYTPREITARFHHRLVQIHPFPNGNGRFARLATDILCEQQGWNLSLWGADNLLKGEARTEYISALREADIHRFERLISFMFPEM